MLPRFKLNAMFYCFYLPAICWQRIAFEFRNKGLALVGVGRQRYILEIDIELIALRYILENKTNPSLEKSATVWLDLKM